NMKPHRMNPAGLIGTVACNEHRVAINGKGQLGLLDHPPGGQMKGAALGNKPSACHEVLRNWRRTFNQTGLDWNKLFPTIMIEYLKDCHKERSRRIGRRCQELKVESWHPSIPIYRRCSFLEKLLNRLLSTRLGLPQRKWVSLRYEHQGWFPLTL